jgi:hypothetical protein
MDVLPSSNLRRRSAHQIAMEQTKLLLVGSMQRIEMLIDIQQFDSEWQEL